MPSQAAAYAYVLNRNFRRINKLHGKAPIDARPYHDEGQSL